MRRGTDDALAQVRDRLARNGGQITPQRVAEALREGDRPVGDAEVLAVHEALRRDVLGAGPLEELVALPGVTDVLVNGSDEVWIDRGAGLELTAVRVGDDDAVRRLAQRLAAAGGRRLDDASPYVDVAAPRRDQVPRRPRPDRPSGHDDLVAGPAAPGLRPGRTPCGRDDQRRGCGAAPAGGVLAGRLPDQRWYTPTRETSGVGATDERAISARKRGAGS